MRYYIKVLASIRAVMKGMRYALIVEAIGTSNVMSQKQNAS